MTGGRDTKRKEDPGKEGQGGPPAYVLRLYVTGMTPRSQTAIRSIRDICETRLKGRYDLEIIDIYRSPHLAEGDQIVAVPTLIKSVPPPLRRFIGDMSDQEKILMGLDLKKTGDKEDREGE
jgi:circadian clock protein KaiB